MSKADSNAAAHSGKPQKPNKPNPDFPLFPHAAGVWAKKIRGEMHYFGPWDDPDAALAKYLAEMDALHAGRKPRKHTEGLTVKELCNKFLNAKRASSPVRRQPNGRLGDGTVGGATVTERVSGASRVRLPSARRGSTADGPKSWED